MEAIQDFLVLAPLYLELACEILGAVTILATAVVKATPSPKDDKAVSKIVSKIWDLISWLPTIGVNPKTKKLEEAVRSLKQ